ncbi:hypothetical protein D5E80_03595 [Vibrio parahaemolyticus]|nr:hypothetical protein D5E80_03595 [Vibrio parahaemolyticus]
MKIIRSKNWSSRGKFNKNFFIELNKIPYQKFSFTIRHNESMMKAILRSGTHSLIRMTKE